jgi:hypothetical protein
MKKFNNFIIESKQVGNIYHFISLINLFYILDEKQLRTYRDIDSFYTLSKSYNIPKK